MLKLLINCYIHGLLVLNRLKKKNLKVSEGNLHLTCYECKGIVQYLETVC